MNNKKYNINFHETFKPELDNIARLIDIADGENFLTKEEIFDLTGIPTGKNSGKVIPHIMYSQYMNLIKNEKEGSKFKLELTPLGKIVKLEDPYIQENITKIILQYFLTSKHLGAEMWFAIIRYGKLKYGETILLENLNKFIRDEFNLKKDTKLTPFWGTYQNGDFRDLDIININDDIVSFNSIEYDADNLYAYAYTLLVDLKMLDANRSEFNEFEIFEDIMWHSGFGISIEQAFEVLEKLEQENIIKVNKQLKPITIIFNSNEDIILEKIYSLLL